MTNREVSIIVREAESRGLNDLDLARHILDRGVTLGEYRRYAMRQTVQFVVACLLAMAAIWAVTEILTGRAG